jgi:Arm DNA-binding domain
MGKSTVVGVKAAKYDPSKGGRPIRLGDGGGLYLQVSSGRGKSWLFRFMLDGRSREMGLGSFEFTGLAEARQLASDARRQLAGGVDPIEARAAAERAAKVAKAQRTGQHVPGGGGALRRGAREIVAEPQAPGAVAQHPRHLRLPGAW